MENSYAVIIPTRNGEKTIAKTLYSLLHQTLQPEKIIVLNDSSRDATPLILAIYHAFFKQQIEIIPIYHTQPRNLFRLPYLINMGLANCPDSKFVMFSGDDSIYQPNYSEKLISYFEENPLLKIASGDISRSTRKLKMPTGSGRMFSYEWLKQHLPFPISSTWESLPLLQAKLEGFQTKCYGDIRFEHLGSHSTDSYRGFGHAMHTLGYYPIFVIKRFLQQIINRVKPVLILYELLGYLEYALCSPEKPSELKHALRQQQKQSICGVTPYAFSYLTNLLKKIYGLKKQTWLNILAVFLCLYITSAFYVGYLTKTFQPRLWFALFVLPSISLYIMIKWLWKR